MWTADEEESAPLQAFDSEAEPESDTFNDGVIPTEASDDESLNE